MKEREKSPIHEAYAEGQSIGAKVKLGCAPLDAAVGVNPWGSSRWIWDEPLDELDFNGLESNLKRGTC